MWEFYFHHLAKTHVKEYVLAVVHESLLKLPWSSFHPKKDHLHMLVSVVDSFLPSCHEFLGKVFVLIPWKRLIRPQDDNIPRFISPLLHIATKLASEPQVREVQQENNNEYPLGLRTSKKLKSYVCRVGPCSTS